MLVIRMQRTGRKGHAMFRVVVQDSRRTPSSGKIVAGLGSYDPHAKIAQIDTEKAAFYLGHGAQPSDRVAALLKKEGVKLPVWVNLADKKAGTIRNLDKLRRNRPAEEAEEVVPEAPAEEPTESTAEVSAPEANDEAPVADAPEVVESVAETSPEASSQAESAKPAKEAAA